MGLSQELKEFSESFNTTARTMTDVAQVGSKNELNRAGAAYRRAGALDIPKRTGIASSRLALDNRRHDLEVLKHQDAQKAEQPFDISAALRNAGVEGYKAGVEKYEEGGPVSAVGPLESTKKQDRLGAPEPDIDYDLASELAGRGWDLVKEDFDKGRITTKAPTAVGNGEEISPEDAIASVGDPKEWVSIMSRIDNMNQLPGEARNAAGYILGYKHYLAKGDLKKADNFLKQAAASTFGMANQLKRLREQAALDGDLKQAVKVAMLEDQFIVNGKDPKVEMLNDGRIGISYVDKTTGEAVNQLLLTPDEMLGMLSNGTLNYETMLRMGRKDPGQQSGGKGGAAAAGQTDDEQATAAMDYIFGDEVEGEESPYTKEQKSRAGAVASRVAAANNLSSDEAAGLVKTVLSAEENAENPLITDQDRLQDKRKPGVVNATIAGTPLTLQKKDFQFLMGLRNDKLAKLKEADEAQQSANSNVDQLKKGLGQIGQVISDDASRVMERNKRIMEPANEVMGSVVSGVNEAVGTAKEALSPYVSSRSPSSAAVNRIKDFYKQWKE